MASFQSGLGSGLQLGRAFAQGQQRRSIDDALSEAGAMVQQGASPQEVLQQLQATNPEAAARFMQMQQGQQELQQNQMILQQQKQRRDALQGLQGDDQIINLFKADPELAGQLVNMQKAIKPDQRLSVGLPLLGALRIEGNDKAKQRIINEAADGLKSFSPALADNLRELASQTGERLDQGIQGTVLAMREIGFLPQDPENAAQSDKTAQEKNLERYIKLRDQDPEVAKRFAQAANLNPEERVQLGVQETRGKETAKQAVERQGEVIGKGLRQAGALGGINRAIDLLDLVDTGGYASAQKYVSDFLGTTPADEAEFAYLTGKTVLGQLKDTFGASFTNEEAKRLEQLEAGLGRSVEANRRILNTAKETAVNAAKRGYQAALEQGDDFAAKGILQQLQSAGVSMDQQPTQQPAQQNQGGKTAQDYINEARQGM